MRGVSNSRPVEVLKPTDLNRIKCVKYLLDRCGVVEIRGDTGYNWLLLCFLTTGPAKNQLKIEKKTQPEITKRHHI